MPAPGLAAMVLSSGGAYAMFPSSPWPHHGPVAQADPGSNRSFSYKILERAANQLQLHLKKFLSSVLLKPTHSVAILGKTSFGTYIPPSDDWGIPPSKSLLHTFAWNMKCVSSQQAAQQWWLLLFLLKEKSSSPALRLSIKAHRYPVYCATDKPISQWKGPEYWHWTAL